MRVGVHGRSMAASLAPQVLDLLTRMKSAGLEPLVHPDLAAWLRDMGSSIPHPELASLDAEVFISLGGDGSFLDTVSLVGRAGVPVLGINLGRLGFLSTVQADEADAAMAAILARRFEVEERSLVEVDGCGDGFGDRNFALNEVSVHKRDSSSMITVHTHLGDRYLNTYWADGLIIATPTGSTAYSLSCGGPLLDPSSRALVITPISPHNLNVRPFVVPDHHEVRLQVDSRGDKYLVNLDSRNITLDAAPELRIRRAPFNARLVRLPGFDFLDTLRAKLAWGVDARSMPGSLRTND